MGAARKPRFVSRYRWTAIVLVVAVWAPQVALGQARLPPPLPPPLLGYCVPPFVPPCIEDLKDHPDRLEACGAQMDRYVASVFAYRGCLSRETERAVRESNAAIAKLRCAQKRGPC